MGHIHTHMHGGACRWRRGTSAVACSPQPAGLPILNPMLQPQVCYSLPVTALLLLLVQAFALQQHWSAFGGMAWQRWFDLPLCDQLLFCVPSLAKAFSTTHVRFRLSVHTWRVIKCKMRYCDMLHLQTTVAVRSRAAELLLVCRIITESTSSLYCCLFSSSRRGFMVCV